ncbi:hypothetical protein GX51_04797 [Blastomyces parvus]|uniref:Uncharacterized protein n=1 Tax=Blastomyces parvus TaxID=2060905 RepID=A0A2B7X0A3_9EURO|nr:hypothetical protein GX51_04797 [Blastomyces parvus]
MVGSPTSILAATSAPEWPSGVVSGESGVVLSRLESLLEGDFPKFTSQFLTVGMFAIEKAYL